MSLTHEALSLICDIEEVHGGGAVSECNTQGAVGECNTQGAESLICDMEEDSLTHKEQ